MSHIQVFERYRVPSEWERTKWLHRIALAVPQASPSALSPSISLGERYFVYLEDAAEDAGREDIATLEATLEEVLDAKNSAPGQPPNAQHNGDSDSDSRATHFIYAPRLGCISPWSDKATDILRAALFNNSCVHRVERARIVSLFGDDDYHTDAIDALLHDRMLERLCPPQYAGDDLFEQFAPRPLRHIGDADIPDIKTANSHLNLGLSESELHFLEQCAGQLGRPLTDAELLMFAQVNSEHCRHKIFNAEWCIDGDTSPRSLFDMIRNTHAKSPDDVLVAYDDNSAVIRGQQGSRWQRGNNRHYVAVPEEMHILMKVETHNHPTAISPFPGAATGVGGEIRDEAATGRGGHPQSGLCGYTVSDLCLRDNVELPDALGAPKKIKFAKIKLNWANDWSWEIARDRQDKRRAPNIESAFDIMLKAPIGAASYGNEFGRPNVLGYFRTYERVVGDTQFAYDKPVMLAGGAGTIRPQLLNKERFEAGTAVVVLGGPAMLIGLGGGSGSSQSAANSDADYASVQRDNAEMQRRCQEVIEHCMTLGDKNPIRAIHDVGAGGLSNAIPELLNDAGLGGELSLADIPSADSSLSPMELWCNESQERYVLAVAPASLSVLEEACAREKCPMAVLGHATQQGKLVLTGGDGDQSNSIGNSIGNSINLDMETLFEHTPKMKIVAQRDAKADSKNKKPNEKQHRGDIDINEAAHRILTVPAVAAKQFLITIADRTVGGLTARDQLVGPWQMPVADCAVMCADFDGVAGYAKAVGERTPVAVDNARASVRLAIAEAVTNIMAADIANIGDIKLSANWMAAMGDTASPAYKADLFDAVQEVGEVLCPALGIAVPVGKDSLSMRTVTPSGDEAIAPLSLIVSAFAPVGDVRRTLTPELRRDIETALYLIDLSDRNNRLACSSLAQCYGGAQGISQGIGAGETADLDDPERLLGLFAAMRELRDAGLVYAWHDRSDGGLWASVCEMAFASRCGLQLDLSACGDSGDNGAGILFAEEPGGVIQVSVADAERIESIFARHGLSSALCAIGTVGQSGNKKAGNKQAKDNIISVSHNGKYIEFDARALRAEWWKTSFAMQTARDNPECASEEYVSVLSDSPGLHAEVCFDTSLAKASSSNSSSSNSSGRRRPRVAILREQGTNGHKEMAAAFDRVGFDAFDVTMSDLMSGAMRLDDFRGVAVCGGFSYGDVLGAGRGWAASVVHNAGLSEQFRNFFARPDTFTLGVCNGCQVLAHLRDLIPGAESWPHFARNRSQQFEARLSLVRIDKSPSLFLRGMEGSRLPVVVSHGEGRAVFNTDAEHSACEELVGLRYVDGHGEVAMHYPDNPNGSIDGVAGLCNADGRVTLMMPHPERVFRNEQFSWRPDDWGDNSPWLKLFDNAYRWTIT